MIRILEESDEEKALSPSMELETIASEIFDPKGVLEVGMGLEHRPEQTAMAVAVARAFAEGESLLFEA